MIDPAAERALLEHMADHGIHPPNIQWDAGFVRFTHPHDGKKNDTGWYKMHSDGQPSGSYDWHGSPHGTITWTFKAYKRPDNGLDLPAWSKQIAEEKKGREKELEKEFKTAAAKCEAEWNKAGKVNPKHPYLIKKGMTDISVGVMRQHGKRLITTIRHIGKGTPFMSLQYIDEKGEKRFGTGTRVHGGRKVIGMRQFTAKNPVFYLTEGFATGWTIHKCTNSAVVICYSLGNLLPVAKVLRKRHPKATLIIAADNDKWKNAGENPGVVGARKVADECEGQLAIPHFNEEWDDGKPTDYNDLYLLEGEKAVRYWLDSTRAAEAVIYQGDPKPPAPVDVTIDLKLKNQTWVDTAPFLCLGFDRGHYYYLPRGTGQVTVLSMGQHRADYFRGIGDGSWWLREFPGRGAGGIDWGLAADALYRAQEKAGVYRSDRLRGRGCWRQDPGRPEIIVHLGDRLLPPGKGAKFCDPETYQNEKGMIYENLGRIEGPSIDRVLSLAGAQKVMDAFRGLLWHEEASGVLLAGWTLLAPLCGALEWRPHVWITGGSGSGKTTVMRNLVLPLLGGAHKYGGMNRFYEGGSTEAGMRQQIEQDALPVLFDEAENVDAKSDMRLQNVLALARSASSTEGAHTAKGSQHGRAVTYEIRSMFCLASIGGGIRQEADRTRISLLQLQSRGVTTSKLRADHWRQYAPILDAINVSVGSEFMARGLLWLRDGRLDETIKIFRQAASGILGDTRSGDQYGTLYAGAWVLMSDHPPTAQDARELVGSEDLEHYVSEQISEGKKALQVLLQTRERIDTSTGTKQVAVGQLVDVIVGHASFITPDEANNFLRQIGMKVDIVDGEHFLVIATGSEWVRKALRETPYADNIHSALRTLPGVGPGGKVRFITGLVSHTTRVPLSSLTDD